MRRRSGTRQVLTSTGLAFTLILALSFIGSRWWWIVVEGSDWAVAIRCGCLEMGGGLGLGPDKTEWTTGPAPYRHTKWWYEHHGYPWVEFGRHPWNSPDSVIETLRVGGWFVSVPLWIPLLLAGVPTVVVCLRGRRRIPPGRCQNCGYNLTGNVSGVCPECGTPTAQPSEGRP